MPFEVINNVIRNMDGRIKYKIFREGGREHFHVGIWVEGNKRELDMIEKVEYKLHPTFKRQIRSSKNRKNNFSVTIWTWGMFNIELTIHLKNGETETLHHYISYDLPEDNGNNYVKV